MTTPLSGAERRQLLTNFLGGVSQQQQSTLAFYGNLLAVPGGLDYRRLLNDVGFPTTVAISYVAPAQQNVQPGSEPRPGITTVNLWPYGGELDVVHLSSTDPVDRQVLDAPQPDGSGCLTYSDDNRFAMPGYCDPDTGNAPRKNIKFAQDLTTPAVGKSWHFYIDRTGDLIVADAIDDVACLQGATATSIEIAFETLVLVLKTDLQTGHTDAAHLVEAPLTSAQLTTLAVVCAKIETVYSTIVETVGTPGFMRQPSAGWKNWNFTNGIWKNVAALDYTESDYPGFFDYVDSLPNFSITTDIFQTAAQVQQPDGRPIARAALSHTDTLGISSALLGAYAPISASARAQEMQGRARIGYFMRAAQSASQRANSTSQMGRSVSDSNAGDTATEQPAPTTVGTPGAAATTPPAPQNGIIFVYSFTSGLWADNNPV
jgi:hypothetical protein